MVVELQNSTSRVLRSDGGAKKFCPSRYQVPMGASAKDILC